MKQLTWLIALLAATPALYVACGGDEATTTSTGTASGGTGGSGTGGSGTGGAGGTATGGAGGATGGSAGTGTGGSAGSAGKAGAGGGMMDAGVMCGTMTCSTNPTGNNVCDTANNRCVDCLNNMDCEVETTNKICDTRLTGMMMLPAYQCVQCVASTDCPAGATCGTNNQCTTMCGTANCSTNPTGNDICDLPNNRCVDCMNDIDCAVETTNKWCDTTTLNMAGLPVYSCEECLVTAHCAANQVCIDNNCENTCMTDTECSADGGGNNPRCNPTTRTCAECGSDAHCMGNQPYCSNEGNCEECLNDAHCMATQPMSPLCRLTDFNCVQCLTSDQCTPPATCGRGGTCTGGGGTDGGGTSPDSGGGGG